jgi:hypothetical protein
MFCTDIFRAIDEPTMAVFIYFLSFVLDYFFSFVLYIVGDDDVLVMGHAEDDVAFSFDAVGRKSVHDHNVVFVVVVDAVDNVGEIGFQYHWQDQLRRST